MGLGGGPWLGSKELQRNVAQVSMGGALLLPGTLPAPTRAALNLRPRAGEGFTADGVRVKVLAMDGDGLRVEKILVEKETEKTK